MFQNWMTLFYYFLLLPSLSLIGCLSSFGGRMLFFLYCCFFFTVHVSGCTLLYQLWHSWLVLQCTLVWIDIIIISTICLFTIGKSRLKKINEKLWKSCLSSLCPLVYRFVLQSSVSFSTDSTTPARHISSSKKHANTTANMPAVIDREQHEDDADDEYDSPTQQPLQQQQHHGPRSTEGHSRFGGPNGHLPPSGGRSRYVQVGASVGRRLACGACNSPD